MLFTSGQIAKTRTRFAVSSDRISCNPIEMKQLQSDIEKIIQKYMDLDSSYSGLQIQFIYSNTRGEQDVKTIQIK